MVWWTASFLLCVSSVPHWLAHEPGQKSWACHAGPQSPHIWMNVTKGKLVPFLLCFFTSMVPCGLITADFLFCLVLGLVGKGVGCSCFVLFFFISYIGAYPWLLTTGLVPADCCRILHSLTYLHRFPECIYWGSLCYLAPFTEVAKIHQNIRTACTRLLFSCCLHLCSYSWLILLYNALRN